MCVYGVLALVMGLSVAGLVVCLLLSVCRP